MPHIKVLHEDDADPDNDNTNAAAVAITIPRLFPLKNTELKITFHIWEDVF